MSKSEVLVITGPTATGKSALGIRLAKAIDGEIVSADSMQVYKHMDIGTAKPSIEEMRGVPHHMIDIIPPWEDYSVARYVEDASKCVDNILRRGKLPIIVGGTGLYIDSLIAGREFLIRGDAVLRRSLEAQYDKIGGEAMLIKLREIDADRAAKLHANDKKRIIRALETYDATGKPISLHDLESKNIPSRFGAIKFALTFLDRSELYARIDRRVDEMLTKGLENEVISLLSMNVSRNNTSMQAIGYKEFADVITRGSYLGTAVERIKMESRRYAKRQLTWLRRDNEVKWINWENTPDFERGANMIMEKIYEKK